MTRRPALALVLVLALLGSLGVAPLPSQAHGGGREVYEQGSFNDPYEFDDDGCGFVFHVDGHQWGHFRTDVVPGSDRQAFLAHNWYHVRETITNPLNGKRMYFSGDGYFREVSATLVKGTVWDFVSVETGAPFVMRDSHRRVVSADHGRVVRKQRFDTLGDHAPGGVQVGDETILDTRGSFPSLEPDFDFCGIVATYLDAEPAPVPAS